MPLEAACYELALKGVHHCIGVYSWRMYVVPVSPAKRHDIVLLLSTWYNVAACVDL